MANGREDNSGANHIFGTDGHANLDEARKKLLEAIDLVRSIFPNRKLEHFLMRELDGRRACEKLRSSCYNGVAPQLIGKILENVELYPFDPFGDVLVGERNVCAESESLSAITVHLPIAENPLNMDGQKLINRRIPLEMTYEFFEFLAQQFKKANDFTEFQTNHKQCDCEHFLLSMFSLVRSITIKHLFTGQAKGKHNTLLVAIACFCVQNKIMLKKPLKGVRATYFPQILENNWTDLCTHLSGPYFYTRTKTLQERTAHKRRWAEAAPFEQKYKDFEVELKAAYPNLFKRDGTFEEQFLDVADPGEVFECINCCDNFPAKFNIICQPRAGTKSAGERHAVCFNCMKRLAEATTNATPFAEDGLGLICVIRGCNNTLSLHSIQRYLSRNVRKMLHDRMTNIVLSMARIPNLERCSRCSLPAINDCPVEANKVHACPRCGYTACRLCEVDWEDHFGKKCAEIPMASRVNNLRRRIDERLIRRCPNCTVPYLKGEACNCVACPCGVSNCYLCQATGINHGHFCNCKRSNEEAAKNPRCLDCGKKCRLFCDSTKWDNLIIAEVKREADRAVLYVLEEQDRHAARGESIGKHSEGAFLQTVAKNLRTSTKPSQYEESPMPPAHWSAFHNPATRK